MTADRARGALAVLQDADGKFICEVPCGYIVEQTASAHKPRRIQAQRRRRAMLRRRVALTVALLTVAALLAALMPWSGSGAADKPKDTTAGTLEEVHQPTAVLLPSSGTVAEYVPNAAEVEALAKLIYGEAGIVPSTTEQAAVVWCVLNRVDDPRFPDTVLEVNMSPSSLYRSKIAIFLFFLQIAAILLIFIFAPPLDSLSALPAKSVFVFVCVVQIFTASAIRASHNAFVPVRIR